MAPWTTLNGTLEEEIYMIQPEGFEVGGSDHVCKLVMSLYRPATSWQGLEQDSSLCTLFHGLQSCPIGPWALYLSQRMRLLMPVFVDDITLACLQRWGQD